MSTGKSFEKSAAESPHKADIHASETIRGFKSPPFFQRKIEYKVKSTAVETNERKILNSNSRAPAKKTPAPAAKTTTKNADGAWA